MSELFRSLSHSKWDCKYHLVFVPKRCRRAIFGPTLRHLGQIFTGLLGRGNARFFKGVSHARACAQVHRHSVQASGPSRERVSQREESDRNCPSVRQGTEFLG
jgi:hypothetical protein